MKKTISVILFFAFILLCGAELTPKLLSSAKKTQGSVLYVASTGKKTSDPGDKKKAIDYIKLLKSTPTTH